MHRTQADTSATVDGQQVSGPKSLPERLIRRPDKEAVEVQVRGWPAQCPGVPLHRQGHPKIISNRFTEMIFRTRPWAPEPLHVSATLEDEADATAENEAACSCS